MKVTRGRVRSLLLTATMLASVILPAVPGLADVQITRLQGADRFQTGVEVSEHAFPTPDEVDTVYVATGLDFPDALAGGSAAFAAGGPILLTAPNQLSAATRDELRRLSPSEVVLVGGPNAVSEDVRTAIEGDGAIGATVRRIGGSDRFETAANVTTDSLPDGVDTLYVATGLNFPDALSGVPAAIRFGGGLLLTAPNELPATTREAITTLAPARIVILGGTGVISRAVEDDLRSLAEDVDRMAGSDRWDTAIRTSRDAFIGARTVYLATGEKFPDALTGGPGAGVAGGPLLLTPAGSLPDEVAVELRRLNPRTVVILGGASAVSQGVADRVAQVLGDTSALPSGATPEVVYNSVDNDPDSAHPGAQTVNVGTLAGATEVLTNPAQDQADIASRFSPDGGRIAFLRGDRSMLSGVSNTDLYLIDVSIGAGSTRKLVETEQFEDDGGCEIADFAWRADGEQLAFICSRDNVPWTAHVVDLRGNVTQVPTEGSDEAEYIALDYSPDGNLLALSQWDGAATDTGDSSRVVTVDPEDVAGGQTLLVQMILTTPAAAVHLIWSGDGSMIAAQVDSVEADVVNIDVAAEDVSIALQDPSVDHFLTDVNADATQLLVITPGTATDADRLRLYRAGTNTVDQELAGPGNLQHSRIVSADLSPDGSQVVYDDLNPTGFNTYDRGAVVVVGADGSGRDVLFEGEMIINAFPSFNPTLGS